ncbi:Reticulon-domain-containing protein [Radiomyces spectabilis]|uniref:Reticulon-domain-containing protein n=1 Tax=Radiomyces spectabilis TaxID=64574 RepID=UPI002220AD3D|nr:Reticulon-domain-containing protein [Radiomyces spectabilis]KAI8381379.1 Reticulon-domain-containing protein [Radiomyces spectabilis]
MQSAEPEIHRRPLTPPMDHSLKNTDTGLTNTAAPTTMPLDKLSSTQPEHTHTHTTAAPLAANDNAFFAPQDPVTKPQNGDPGFPTSTMDQTMRQRKAPGVDTSKLSNNDSFERKEDKMNTGNRPTRSYSGSSHRNETTDHMEREVWRVLRWENPVRSAAILVLSVGSILLTRHYSLLQISSALLTVAIGLNFLYVTFMTQSQKVFNDGQSSHPYTGVLQKESLTEMNKQNVQRYSSVLVDLAETVAHALARIVLIENSATSLKWLAIFYTTWTISAYVSSMTILLIFLISAFIFPRLYLSNKDVVDAHLQQGETLLRNQLSRAQGVTTDTFNDAYHKARAYMAQVGTTGTDAANTLNRESVVLKDN